MTKADVEVQNEGSIYLFRPLTVAGRVWIENHVDGKEATFFGNALVVEHRYAMDIAAGMFEAGLVLR